MRCCLLFAECIKPAGLYAAGDSEAAIAHSHDAAILVVVNMVDVVSLSHCHNVLSVCHKAVVAGTAGTALAVPIMQLTMLTRVNRVNKKPSRC